MELEIGLGLFNPIAVSGSLNSCREGSAFWLLTQAERIVYNRLT